MTRRILLWIKIFVAAALLGLMLQFVKPAAIWQALRSARFELVAVGALLMPVNIWLQEYKWRYLVRLVRPAATASETTGSLLGGFAFGIVTPGRLGEYGRALFINDTPPMKLVGLTVIDKFYNLGCTVAFGLPALVTLPFTMKLLPVKFFVPLLALVGVINLFLLFLALDTRPVKSLIYALQLMLPKGNQIAQLVGGLERFGGREARVTLLLTLAHYAVYLAQYYFIINGFCRLGLAVSARGAAAVLFTKSALPISIGDLGLDQLVSVQFFGQFGALPGAAFDASLLLFAFNVLLPALAGVAFMGRLQIGKKS
jgi:uncharacterized membrane protein YbhN (UPF0104 family)